MAQKRMFDRAIIETDNFLNVSMSAKALYFLLGMEADDEGFVSPNRVLRLYGGEMGDIKNLIDTGLVIPFKTGVVVITHWKENNYLDKNRIKPTQYVDEKSMLLTVGGKYVFNKRLTGVQPVERRGEENRGEETPQISLTAEDDFKYEAIEKPEYSELFEKFWSAYPKKVGKGAAYKAWLKIKPKPSAKFVENMLEVLEKQKGQLQWRKDNGQFIPHPATYINQKRWDDQVETPSASTVRTF